MEDAVIEKFLIGSGDGYGYGSGYGDWKEYDGRKVYYIDDLPTLIFSVHSNYAKGAIVGKDLVLKPCFIATTPAPSSPEEGSTWQGVSSF